MLKAARARYTLDEFEALYGESEAGREMINRELAEEGKNQPHGRQLSSGGSSSLTTSPRSAASSASGQGWTAGEESVKDEDMGVDGAASSWPPELGRERTYVELSFSSDTHLSELKRTETD